MIVFILLPSFLYAKDNDICEYKNYDSTTGDPFDLDIWKYLCLDAVEKQKLGNKNKAHESAQKAFNFARTFFGAEHPLTVKSFKLSPLYSVPDDNKSIPTNDKLHELYSNSADEYQNGNHINALQWAQKAHEYAKTYFGSNSPDTIITLSNLAVILFSLQRFDESEAKLKKALQVCEKVHGYNDSNTLKVINNLADFYSEQEQFKNAEIFYEKGLEISEKVYGAKNPFTLKILCKLSSVFIASGQIDKAESNLTLASKLLKNIDLTDNKSKINIYIKLSESYQKINKNDHANNFLNEALNLNEKIHGPSHPDTIQNLNLLADFYKSQGRYDEADDYYFRIIREIQKKFGLTHPNTLKYLTDWATNFLSQGKSQKAEELFEFVWLQLNNKNSEAFEQGNLNDKLAIYSFEYAKKYFGLNHYNTFTSLNNLAALYKAQNKFDLSEKYFIQALKISEGLFGKKDRNTLTAMNNLAGTYNDMNKNKDAEALYKKVCKLSEDVLGTNDTLTISSLNNLGMLYESQGRFDEAEPILMNVLQIVEKEYGSKHQNTIQIINNLAGMYMDQGNFIKAEPLYLKALKLSEEVLGANHSMTLTILSSLTKMYKNQKRYVDADDLVRRNRILSKKHEAKRSEEKVSLDNEKRFEEIDEDILIENSLQLRNNNPELFNNSKGIVILKIVPDSQASSLGLQPGDIILKYSGIAINTEKQFLGLVKNNASKKSIELCFLRDNQVNRLNLKGGYIGVYFSDFSERKILYRASKKYNELGQYHKSINNYKKILRIDRKSGNLEGESSILRNIGVGYWHLGQADEAIKYIQDAMEIHEQLNNKEDIVEDLYMITTMYKKIGDEVNAIKFSHQADFIKVSDIGKELSTTHNEFLQNFIVALEPFDERLIRNLFNSQPQKTEQVQQWLFNKGKDKDDTFSSYYNALGGIIADYRVRYIEPDIRAEQKMYKDIESDLSSDHKQLVADFIIAWRKDDLEKMQPLVNQNLQIVKDIISWLNQQTGEDEYLVFISSIRELLQNYSISLSDPSYVKILDNIKNNGFKAYQSSNYRKAIEIWQEGLKIAEGMNLKNSMQEFQNNIALALSKTAQYEKAMRIHKKLLKIALKSGSQQNEAHALGNIGLIYIYLAQYRKALDYLSDSLKINRELGNRNAEGIDIGNIGMVYKNLGQYENALKYFQQALEIHKEFGDNNDVARVIYNIGVVLSSIGHYQQALNHYHNSLNLYKKINNRHGMAGCFSGIGTLYAALSQHQNSYEYYEKSLEINREIGDKRGEGKDYANIGNNYKSAGDFQEALDYFGRSLSIYKEIGEQNGKANTLLSIGGTYINMGKYSKALSICKESLISFRKLGNEGGESSALICIGSIYNKTGQYDNAISIFQECMKKTEKSNIEKYWHIQIGLAFSRSKLNQLEKSIELYEEAINSIEAVRSDLREKADKRSFFKNTLAVYDELIILLYNLHKKYPNKGYNKKSLEVFEKKQARIYLEEIGRSGTRRISAEADDIIRNELKIHNQILQVRFQINEERSKHQDEGRINKINKLESQLESLKDQQRVVENELLTRHPDYYNLLFPKPVNFDELKNDILQHDEMVLVYLVMKERTVLWLIGQNIFEFLMLDITKEELLNCIKSFRSTPNQIISAVDSKQQLKAIQISKKTIETMAKTGYDIYKMIIPESINSLISESQTLFIVPTGPLYNLPFEALATQQYVKGKEIHYLIQDHAISYLSSTSLLKVLRETKERRGKKTRYPFLAFADPIYPKSCRSNKNNNYKTSVIKGKRTHGYLRLLGKKSCFSQNDEIPNSSKEAQKISQILNVPLNSNALQLRANASRSNVFRLNKNGLLDDYRFLLFSAHSILPGEIDYINQPALVLSYPEEEGYLLMNDIYYLRLDADLTVLSACNTGIGEYESGEGIMSMTRAFMYAGTQSVSVTLWAVDSLSSQRVNEKLFRYLKTKIKPTQALRKAKLDLLNNAKIDDELDYFRHPFFWAPFILFGDGS